MRLIPSLLVFLFFLFAAPVHSQIVNIESARMQSDTVGWMGNAGAVFRLIKNTQNIIEIGVNSHLQYKTKKDLWLIMGQYGFLKAGGQKFIRNGFGHLRYNRKFNNLLRWEAFVQAQNNFITQIDSRYLIGTGPRFKLADTKSFHLYAACLFMYEYEKESTVPAVVHNDIRNSSYISFTIKLDQMVELISTTFYQPLLKKMSDFRILNEAQLRIKTGKHFAFTVQWNYLHDRFPAGNAPQTTYDLEMGLQYGF
jgi:Protein of unknown function, DUF481